MRTARLGASLVLVVGALAVAPSLATGAAPTAIAMSAAGAPTAAPAAHASARARARLAGRPRVRRVQAHVGRRGRPDAGRVVVRVWARHAGVAPSALGRAVPRRARLTGRARLRVSAGRGRHAVTVTGRTSWKRLPLGTPGGRLGQSYRVVLSRADSRRLRRAVRSRSARGGNARSAAAARAVRLRVRSTVDQRLGGSGCAAGCAATMTASATDAVALLPWGAASGRMIFVADTESGADACTGGATLVTLDTGTGEQTRVALSSSDSAQDVVASPDGMSAYVIGCNTIWAVNGVDETSPAVVSQPADGGAGDGVLAISPDGGTLYFTLDGSLYSVPSSLSTTPSEISSFTNANGVAVSADGTTLYVSDDRGLIYAYGASSGTEVAKYDVGTNPYGIGLYEGDVIAADTSDTALDQVALPAGTTSTSTIDASVLAEPFWVATTLDVTGQGAYAYVGGTSATPGAGLVCFQTQIFDCVPPVASTSFLDMATTAGGWGPGPGAWGWALASNQQLLQFDTMNAANALEDSFGGFSDFAGVAGAPHQSPTANFFASAQATPANTMSFDAAASTSEDGIASYSWDFGDGGSGSGESPAHTYAAAGTYQVTLTVDDGEQCPGQVTDGRRIICQGSSQATVTKSVTVGSGG